jgi:peptidyl-tRNA hydrolase
MKMYILVRESLGVGHAILAASHGSLAAYLKFRDAPETTEWISGPFRKVVCKVTDEELERAKTIPDHEHVVLTESSLGGIEVALAFKPRAAWDKFFQFLRLYK